MTTGQKKAFDSLWSQYGLDEQQSISDLNRPFQRHAPKVMEIGFGMGDSLATQALTHPYNDYIGIEVHRPGVGHLLSLMEKQHVANIRLFCADAVEVLSHCIPNDSLDVIQIFFPDPWPKKRHHKRRIVQPAFISLLCKKLKSGGKLHLATDWENYAEHMVDVLRSQPALVNTATQGEFVARPDSRPLTKFEHRGLKLGHGVWDLVYKKK